MKTDKEEVGHDIFTDEERILGEQRLRNIFEDKKLMNRLKAEASLGRSIDGDDEEKEDKVDIFDRMLGWWRVVKLVVGVIALLRLLASL